MKYLIVGLGNIGAEYAHTRHNIGFDVLDRIAEEKKVQFTSGKHSFVTEVSNRGRKLILVKPTTFMNLSGKAVRYWINELKIPVENILIVTDDLFLPVGKIRLKPKGSDGGHNGLKNIQELLGTNKYPRLRFGIGSEFSTGKQVDFVLGKFTGDEKITVDLTIDKAIQAIYSFSFQGLDKTMNNFN